ncbi:hypothetical protein AAVH_16332 [Aphelenchoides avenae]|nr:hypothetical protein AAVH_16332 [Aphelenchus avenae]
MKTAFLIALVVVVAAAADIGRGKNGSVFDLIPQNIRNSLPADIKQDLAHITMADIKRVEQAVKDASVEDVNELLPVLRRASSKLYRIAMKILNKYPLAGNLVDDVLDKID